MNGNGKLGRTKPWVVLAVALACGLLSASSALAKKPAPPQPPGEWEVTILHPTGDHYESGAHSASGAEQAGFATAYEPFYRWYDLWRAGLWSGTAESWVDLHPADAWESCAYGSGDGQQVGVAHVFDGDRGDWFNHAGLWSGTAESWVDLHPAQYGLFEISRAYATDGGRQVGEAGWYWHQTVASLWTGTAESWVDLHPYDFPGSYWDWSCAFGVCGNEVVGHIIGAGEHAMLWTVEPYSWVDLHPPKAKFSVGSVAYDVSDGQQVGVVVFNKHYQGSKSRASLWSGTAESWVDLHPDGYLQSVARGVSHGFQAGSATMDPIAYWYWMDGDWHAGIWSGTAGSWVDLHTLLPAEYVSSIAQDIEVTATDIWVVGSAEYYDESFQRRSHAVVWHKSLSE
jgi:hypothetical protein